MQNENCNASKHSKRILFELPSEEPQHTDLATVIEWYAISGGEEPQQFDF